MGKVIFLCLILISGLLSSFADKDVNEGQINVKVLGKSGKIAVKNKKGNSAVILLDYIHELDSSNAIVGKKGKKKHSINSFATQDFTFRTQGLSNKYQGIDVNNIEFQANMSGTGAILKVNIYIFKASGNITTANNEEITVVAGTVKFDIDIMSWTFCGGSGGESCTKGGQSPEVGDKLELGIEIKGRKAPKDKARKRGKGRRMKTMDIGGADCTLSGQVRKDGVWQEMEANYPKVEKKGQKTLFMFRLPRFVNNTFYDPTLDMSSTAPSGAAASNKGHMAIILMSALAALLKFIF